MRLASSGVSCSRRSRWWCCVSKTNGRANTRCRSTSTSAASKCQCGLLLIFLILLSTAILNLFTKEVATVSGILFTLVFLHHLHISEHFHEKRRKGTKHAHLEQFNQATTTGVPPASLGLTARLSQTRRHSFDAKLVHAGKSTGGNRPANDEHCGNDGEIDANTRFRASRISPTWIPTISEANDRRG